MSRTIDMVKHLEVVEGLLKLASMHEDKVRELTEENEALKHSIALLQREQGPENTING